MHTASRLVPSCLVLALLAGCGGGGGGAPASASLQGVLTVPQLGQGGGRLIPDRALDSVAHHAQEVGALAAGDALDLRGRVGGDDALDVFRLTAARSRLVVQAPAAARVEVFDAVAVRCVLTVPAGAQAELRALQPVALDVAVAARAGEIDYAVTVTAIADDGTDAPVAPLPREARSVASDLLVPYVGAQHEMVAGQVVVQFPENAVAPLAVNEALARVGLVAAEAIVPGPLQIYSVTAPLLSVRDGAPLAASLELETCLAAQRALAVPGVRAASPNYVYRAFQNNPNDPLLVRQWHYTQIKAQQAWALFAPNLPGSTDVIVAIVDTGMVLAHPDFAGRLINGFDMISDPARALDGDGIDANPDDPGDNAGTGLPSTFHGTHVGGTVGATTNNSVGVAGMDWSCKLMPIRVLGKNGGTLNDIAQGMRFCSGLANASGTVPPQRADLMNLSLGGPGSAAVLDQACVDCDAAGVLLVAAAGNDNSSTPNFPGSNPVCICVGAIRFDQQRAPYSNFANTIDVVAPGGDTSVDQSGDGDPDGVLSCLAALQGNQLQVGFGYLQGTSMASPHVAGVASLVKARGAGLTNTQIRNVIETNTTNVASGKLVDTFAACNAAGAPPTTPILRADRTNVALTSNAPTANVALSNVGINTITLVQGNVGITYESGNGWLTATLAGAPGTGISHTRLDIAANPAGLGNGRHSATIAIAPGGNVNTVQILVTITVGTVGGGSDEIFVVAADSITIENRGQAQTNAGSNFAYAINGVAVGNYLLVAGTDRDNDGFIGDEGELFGIWPSNDSPLVLSIPTTGTFTGLDFTLQLQQVQSVAPRKLPPIRLRN